MVFIRKNHNVVSIDSHTVQTLYESMHSIGNVIFISDIFNKIANLASALIGKTGISSQAEITVIGINLPADKQSAFKNFNLHCIGSKDLARYVPNDPKVKWIDFIDIS